MSSMDVDVTHRGRDPGMAEDLLDRDQVQAAVIELGGAEVPQHMRSERISPAWKVLGRGIREPDPQGVVADPGPAAVGVTAFGREPRRAWPVMVIVEVTPHR